MQAADSDYQSKVQLARSQRQELLDTLRPQAVKALLDLINECDSGLTLQLQKYGMFFLLTSVPDVTLTLDQASFHEKLLLGNGLCISPLKGQNSNQGLRSLRDVIQQIHNTRDLDLYVSSFASKAGGKTSDIRYERHPVKTTTMPSDDIQKLTWV